MTQENIHTNREDQDTRLPDRVAELEAELQQLRSERQAVDQRVVSAQKLETLEMMWGGIAHDFNNLLMGVLGNAELISDDIPVFSPLHSVVDDIILCANRASDLCRQMMAYAGKPGGVREIEINQVIKGMTNLAHALISKNIELREDMNDHLPRIAADPVQLSQIIMNMLINAADEIGARPGEIRLNTGAMHCDEDYLRETFSEEGLHPGRYVYVEVVHRLPETAPSKEHPSYTEKNAGKDLGMAVVIAITRAHKGTIKMIHGPGSGSGYRILFPALVPPESAAGQDAEAPWGEHGIILLVDDEATILTVGERMLNKLGFTVITAGDGDEAVAIFKEGHTEIDCVMLDVAMARKDGIATLQELREIKPDVPVIMMSGYSESQIKQQLPDVEVGFIQKPYNRESLKDVLQKALR
ncbi:MAG: response regulator [Spartobacteria bacterium]|nr:response regulator [Spartobacteria bacterium]